MPDYGANCYRGCGRVAVVIEGDSRYCARCWMDFTLAHRLTAGLRLLMVVG